MGVTFKWIFIIFRCCTLCKVVCTTHIEDCALCKWIAMFAFHKCCQNCLISSLATSPLHNECGDFFSPSMWESSQAASLSTIQRGEKSEKPTRVKNKWSRCVNNFEYPRIRAHIEETFGIAKQAGRKADRVQFKQLLQFPRFFVIENFDSWSRLASRWKPILWKLLLALL